MATKGTSKKKSPRKKKKGQLSFKMGLNDERVPKLFGLLLILFSIYLFVAFTSYLFTWEGDMDRVHNSWSILFQTDLEIQNWLGRLGALVSHNFFYYLFGLPSFIVAYLFFFTGLNLIKRRPSSELWPRVITGLAITFFLSILLGFIFKGYPFPMGGVGRNISAWISNFIGNIGIVALFLFTIITLLVWNLNPNFNDLTIDSIILSFTKSISKYIPGMKGKLAEEELVPAETAPTPIEEIKPLRPTNLDQFKQEKEEMGTMPTGEQLAFELNKERKLEKPPSLKVGESTLEIEEKKEDPTPIPLEEQQSDHRPLVVEKENEDHMDPYDPTLDLPHYENPVLALLEDYEDQKQEMDRAELEANKDQIIETLLHYKIEITKIKATIGPTVTLYEIVPAPGVRISKIKNLEDDIALSLAALGIRIIAPIPGKGTIGIEVPNKHKKIVSLKEVLRSDKFKYAKMDLPIALGKTISDEVFVADLAKMPHLLIAGATGQGKSVGINTILMSLLYKKHPTALKLVLIDPKKVELFPYGKIDKHFLGFLPGEEEPIVTETSKVVNTLNSLCIEMDQRYDLLKKAKSRNLKEYNQKFIARKLNPQNGHKFLPFIVLVIDEFADMIMTAGKEVELPIGRLAQLARAVGIHLIIATQRPSVNIITGVIKANFPARLAFKVSSKIDSRTILDGGGADQLIGRGDMLLSVGGDTIRLQCAFVDTPEVENVIDFIGDQKGLSYPYLLPEYSGDEEQKGASGIKFSEVDVLFEDAAELVVSNQQGSTSMIQRRMKLGYNRAGRIMDQMEAFGIVGPNEGSKAREVLIFDVAELKTFIEYLKTK